MELKVLDLFSGAGGFSKGIEMAGHTITKHYFSEIDKHAIANYLYNFKNAKYYGSVTDVRGRRNEVDIITFGSPCQDFSLAGKRAGMEGQRSSLILEAIRLIDEIRPSIFVWENVKGTFSSNNGADFWAIISSFANIGGYRLEWQLLNTSWFLPQNRERIYLVGYSTETKRDWRGVFPIGESNPKIDELQRQHLPANTILQRYDAGANGTYIGECKQSAQAVKQIGTKLDSNGGTQPYQQDRVYDADGIVPALNQGKSDLIIKANYSSKSLNETIENNILVEGEPKALDLYNRSARDESPTLTEPHHNSLRMFDGYRIRRLTPIECERLQGFPDDHTSLGNYDGEVKSMSNAQRYKQCGNAVTVDVVKAVAERCKPLFK